MKRNVSHWLCNRYIIVFSMFQVNALDGLGQTPLHRCAGHGNMQACRLLLQYGVDPSIVSLQGYTAAQLAPDTIQKLLMRDTEEIINNNSSATAAAPAGAAGEPGSGASGAGGGASVVGGAMAGATDVDMQLLEAAKSGELDIVKVREACDYFLTLFSCNQTVSVWFALVLTFFVNIPQLLHKKLKKKFCVDRKIKRNGVFYVRIQCIVMTCTVQVQHPSTAT